MAISRAFLSTPSNHGCVKSSAIYLLLGRMTFAISVIDYLRWRGCPALAPLASHQMLCFLYFGDRWPPLAPFDTFFDFFSIFLFFLLFMLSATNVSLAGVKRTTFYKSVSPLNLFVLPPFSKLQLQRWRPKKKCALFP